MAAVDQHGELDARRPPVIEESVDRGPHRAPGEEDVVDQDDRATVWLEVEVRAVNDRLRAGFAPGNVVAVKGDVEVAKRDLRASELANEGVQPTGDHGSPRVYSNERYGTRSRVLFDDLVRDPDESPAQVITIEDNPFGLNFHLRAPSWSHWTWLKEPTKQG
jgi:hypothetical protein